MKGKIVVRTASQILNSQNRYHLNTYNCDLIIQDKNVFLLKYNELVRSKLKYNFRDKVTVDASQRIGFTYDDLLNTLENIKDLAPENQINNPKIMKRNYWKIGDEKIKQYARVWSEKKIYQSLHDLKKEIELNSDNSSTINLLNKLNNTSQLKIKMMSAKSLSLSKNDEIKFSNYIFKENSRKNVELKNQKVMEKIKKDHQNLIDEISKRSIVLNDKMEKARIRYQSIMQEYKDRGLTYFYNIHREVNEKDVIKEKNRIMHNIQKKERMSKRNL